MRNAIAQSILILGLSILLWGFVNPNFTPVHVVQDSGSIIHYRVALDADDSTILRLTPVANLKGDAPQIIGINLSNVGEDEYEHELVDALNRDGGSTDALLFVPAAEGDSPALHIGRYWVILSSSEDGNWSVSEWGSGHWLGAWDGGTDQLIRVIRYVISDPDPSVPAVSGADWDGYTTGQVIPGEIRGMGEVVTDDGSNLLFIASTEGDHLLRWDADEESWSAVGESLGSASLFYAWGDFTGDGSLDLASAGADGLKIINLDSRSPSAAAPVAAVTGLAVVPGKGRNRLAVSTGEGLSLLQLDEQGAWQATALALPETISEGNLVLAGDIAGRGRIDLLLFHAGGALWFAAEGDSFAAGQPATGIEDPGILRKAVLVDLDSDRLPEIVAVGSKGYHLWHNYGEGNFRSRAEDAGEFRYIPNFTMRDIIVHDFNHDGRPDLTLLNPGMGPHIFYGRGFMVFGFAEDLVGATLPDDIYQGQQAGVYMDLNGDGFHQLVCVLSDGTLMTLNRNTDDHDGTTISLRLDPSWRAHGPLLVEAGDEDRETYGRFLLQPGAQLSFGRTYPGPLMLRWIKQGKQVGDEMVVLEDGHQQSSIGDEGLR